MNQMPEKVLPSRNRGGKREGNKNAWFSGHKRIACVALVLLALMLVFLSGSVVLQQQKKETCQNVVEVWEDVGHLLSQKQDGALQLSHGFASLHRYLCSNLLDASLYEWRLLEGEDRLPRSPDTCYLSWQGGSQGQQGQPREGTNVVPVVLSISTAGTTFHDNPTELDYIHQGNTVEVDGRVLYTYQDGKLLWSGYTSKVTRSSFVTDTPQDTQTTQQSWQGASFGQISSISSELDCDLTRGAGRVASPVLDCGAQQP